MCADFCGCACGFHAFFFKFTSAFHLCYKFLKWYFCFVCVNMCVSVCGCVCLCADFCGCACFFCMLFLKNSLLEVLRFIYVTIFLNGIFVLLYVWRRCDGMHLLCGDLFALDKCNNQSVNQYYGWGFGLVVRATDWHTSDHAGLIFGSRDGLYSYGCIPSNLWCTWYLSRCRHGPSFYH
jgi:hypothetical protein